MQHDKCAALYPTQGEQRSGYRPDWPWPVLGRNAVRVALSGWTMGITAPERQRVSQMQGRLCRENSTKSRDSQERKCKRDDEKLRVLESVMKRLARVLGTICVGYSPVGRFVVGIARLQMPGGHRLRDTRKERQGEHGAPRLEQTRGGGRFRRLPTRVRKGCELPPLHK